MASSKAWKYSQGYLKSWESDKELKDWIACDDNNSTRAYCKYCKCSLLAHKKDLLNHAKTMKHERAAKHCLVVQSTKPLTVFSAKPRAIKIIELKLSTYVAEHCSINCINHLSELIKTLDPKSVLLSDIKLHRTKCTMLIKNVIGPSMLESLVEDVGDANFSLIIDESTDVSTCKTLCMIIKYFSVEKKRLVTTFYRIVEIENCSAEGIFTAVRGQLEKDKLKVEKLIGIGTDNANVMVGARSSFSVLLKAVVPDLVVVRCVCHSLHLCAEYACKELPRQLEYLIRECHNYFSLSPKRLAEYAKFYETNRSQPARRIPKLAGTRWLAREAAVNIVLDQWDELFNFFKRAMLKDKCYAAEQLVNIMNVPAYKAFLTFLKLSLNPICKTNLMFQGENIDVLLLFQDLFILYKSFLSKLVVPSQLEKVPDRNLILFPFKEHLMHVDCMYFGHDFEILAKKLVPADAADVRRRCANFLIEFCAQLQQRLPGNIQILEKISSLRPEIATSQKKPSLSEILDEFHRFNKSKCEEEWVSLSSKKWDEVGSTEEFWAKKVFFDIDSAHNPRYPNIARFALSLLSLPISNAAVERAFSIYNSVKTKLRNRLSIDVIQNILMIRSHLLEENISCTQFQPSDKMLSRFNSSMYDHMNTESHQEIEEVLEIDCCDLI